MITLSGCVLMLCNQPKRYIVQQCLKNVIGSTLGSTFTNPDPSQYVALIHTCWCYLTSELKTLWTSKSLEFTLLLITIVRILHSCSSHAVQSAFSAKPRLQFCITTCLPVHSSVSLPCKTSKFVIQLFLLLFILPVLLTSSCFFSVRS